MKQHYIKALALFCLSLALGACSKNKTAPTPGTIDFGANEGYTGRDNRAVLTGPADPTDWTVDATWNNSEKAIFERPFGIYFSKQPASTSVWKVSAYPNPVVADGRSILSAILDRPTSPIPSGPGMLRMAYAVVDATYAVQTTGDTGGVNANFGTDIMYDASKFRPNTLYRIYYVIYDDVNNAVYLKGHGDIKVMP